MTDVRQAADGWQIDSGPSRPASTRHWGLRAGEALVVLVLLTSFYVKSQPGQDQPTPYDLAMAGTIGLLFLFGLKLPRGLGWPAAMWGLVVIGYGLGAMNAVWAEKARSSFMVTVYLIGLFFFFTSFVYADPARRMAILFWAYTAAACIAAFLAVGGYFRVLPGSELFIVYGRATGTFNDPNVFGPFLVAPIIFLGMKLSLARSLKSLWMVVPLGLLTLGLFLSFSRGAWGNLLFSALVFFILTLKTSTSARQTFRLIGFAALISFLMTVVVGVALSTPAVSDLFAQRASLTQDYDTDPQHGRFESQARAFSMALEKPFGVGPAQWAMINNLDTHNVYLHVLIAGGFLSGLAFVGFVGITLFRGWRAIGAGGPEQGAFIVAYAVLFGHFVEGAIIDIDNWRHLYLLLGIVWGAILAVESRRPARGIVVPRQAAATAWPSMSGFRT